jgi:hypothetical protein
VTFGGEAHAIRSILPAATVARISTVGFSLITNGSPVFLNLTSDVVSGV